MGETKEKQYLVQGEYELTGRRAKSIPLRWFDSRAIAREYAKDKNKRKRRHGIVYRVYPMTRGPHA